MMTRQKVHRKIEKKEQYLSTTTMDASDLHHPYDSLIPIHLSAFLFVRRVETVLFCVLYPEAINILRIDVKTIYHFKCVKVFRVGQQRSETKTE